MKRRFKKALFSFFKDEIIANIGLNEDTHIIEHVSSEIKIIEIKSEIIITNTFDDFSKPATRIYEEALESCKRKLFEESMKYVQIDSKSILDQYPEGHRSIKVSLFLGNKVKN